MGECPHQKHIFSLEINYAEQNGYLEILIGCDGGMMYLGEGGLIALQSLSTIKKGTSPLNFQSTEPVLKFQRQRLL
jgi:hypothetical protein